MNGFKILYANFFLVLPKAVILPTKLGKQETCAGKLGTDSVYYSLTNLTFKNGLVDSIILSSYLLICVFMFTDSIKPTDIVNKHLSWIFATV